jgi:hypothetical protein
VTAHDDKYDTSIDELFQVPLNEFTARRNALAKTLAGADASRIRALTKPSVAAWAVNQVYWHARSLYDRLIKSGERLRNAQIAALEGKRADVRSASDAHRRAVADAVAEAVRLANAAGSHPSPDPVMRTFESISLAAKPPEHPGRLSEAMQPAGFEALTGVTPKAQAPGPRSGRDQDRGAPAPSARENAALSASKDDHAERARRRQEAAEARVRAAEGKKRQSEIRKRQAAIARAKAVEARSRAAWERAQQALRKAEERLAAIQSPR